MSHQICKVAAEQLGVTGGCWKRLDKAGKGWKRLEKAGKGWKRLEEEKEQRKNQTLLSIKTPCASLRNSFQSKRLARPFETPSLPLLLFRKNDTTLYSLVLFPAVDSCCRRSWSVFLSQYP